MVQLTVSSLRIRLLLFVVLAMLPVLALTLHSAVEQRRAAAAVAQGNALGIARIIRHDQERLIREGQHLVTNLSKIGGVRTANPQNCHRVLRDIREEDARFLNLGAVGADGLVFCSARQVFPDRIPGPALARAAAESRRTGGFAISGFALGRITGRPIVVLTHAAHADDGSVPAVVFATLSLDWATRVVAQARLPRGATVTIVDTQGTVMVRSPAQPGWVGRPFPAGSVRQRLISTDVDTVFTEPGADGRTFLFASAPVKLANGRRFGQVVIGIPRETAYAQADGLLRRNLLWLGALTLMALMVAWFGADLLIVRRVQALLNATRRLQAGDRSARIGITQGTGELEALARAFDEMAESLERRHEEALQSAEAIRRQALVFETLLDAVVITDARRRIIEWNQGAERIFGYGRAEVFGQSPTALLAADGAAEAEAQVMAAIAETGRWAGELRFRARDGRVGVSESVVVAQHDAEGQLIAYIGVHHDVTERKQAEAATQAATEQARRMAARMHAVATAAASVVSTDSVDDLDGVLRVACAQVIAFDSFTFALYDPAADALDFLAGFDAGIFQGGERVEVAGTPSEWVIRQRRSLVTGRATDAAAQGAQLWGTGRRSESVIRTPILSGDRVLGVLSVQSYTPDLYTSEDVEVLETVAALAATTLLNIEFASERAVAAEALRRSEERYAVVATLTYDAIWELDLASGAVVWNDTFATVFGGEVPDHEAWTRRIHEDDRVPVLASFREAADTGAEVWSAEYRFRRDDGSYAFVYDRARLIYAEGRPVRVIGAMMDISERKRAEEALRQSEEQLQQSQKMEAVGRLAGGIAHDFNNLLTAVKGNVEIALLELPHGSPARPDLEQVLQAADTAASLTRQLLSFTRRQAIHPEVIAPAEVIGSTTGLLRRLLGTNIDLLTRLDADTWPVRLDPVQLEQVLMNLAINARDAMPHGGRLSMESRNVELDEEHPLRPSYLPPGSYVLISVSDTGVGIHPDSQAHIFEPFFTTKPGGKGTGLGLFTVYGIVRQSGGCISVESHSGAGTTFSILLPRAASEARARPGQEPSGELVSGSETILLVEDEAPIRLLTHRLLQRIGYTVLVAPDGEEALRLLATHDGPVDLMLTDMTMPRMGGRELASRIVQLMPGLPIVFMSGYTEDELPLSPDQGRPIHFIHKPFTLNILAKTIREALDVSA